MMQRKIILSDKIDLARADAAFNRAAAKRRISVVMLSNAAQNHPDFEAKAVWYAVVVAAGSEMTVKNRLVEANICAWVPMRKTKKVRVNGRWKPAVARPVLEGFVFVRAVPGPACWAGLGRVKGVICLLGDGESPYRIRNEEMNQFNSKAKAGGYDYDKGFVLPDELTVECRVMIKEGPFAQFEGPVTHIHGDDVVVEVTIFGRASPVRLPLAMVSRLS